MVSQIARKIGHIPEQYESGNNSTALLLDAAGPPDRRAEVSVEEMEQVLRDAPDLTRLWLRRGGDQRFSGGWGIEHTGRDYKLLNFGDGRSQSFRDRVRACAEFVVHYVRFIGEAQARLRH